MTAVDAVVEAGCPGCGSNVATLRPRCTAMVRPAFPGSRVVQCAGCRLCYLFPNPTAVDGLYEETYFQAYAEKGMPFPTEGRLRQRYRHRLRRLRSMTGGGTLLDIGVGHGGFLEAARREGWKVIGVDVSRYAAECVRRTYGIEVHCGTLEDAALTADSVDVIHMSHVLEHLAQPVTMLQETRRVLRPGGMLAVEVPNELDTLLVRVRHALGSSRTYSVPSTHLIFFSPRTLAKTVAGAGYVVRHVKTLRDLADGSVARRAVKVAVGLVERPLGLAPLIELFAEKSPRGAA